MEGARIGSGRQKRFPAKYQREDAQGMASLLVIQLEQAIAMAGDSQDGRKVEFEELFGHGARTGIVQPPPIAIRQDAPTQIAGGQVINTSQITEHLR